MAAMTGFVSMLRRAEGLRSMSLSLSLSLAGWLDAKSEIAPLRRALFHGVRSLVFDLQRVHFTGDLEQRG